VGVTIARFLIGAAGGMMILGGIAVAAVGGPGGGLLPALYLFLPGAVLIAAVVLERTRYRSLTADRAGDGTGPGGGEPGAPEPRFRPTGERFVDPTTSVPMRVFVDAATGERRYVPEG
jgi:hypothetical protein